MRLRAWAFAHKRALVAIGLIPVLVGLVRFGLIEAYSYALDAHKRGEYSAALPIVWGNALFADTAACGLLGVMYLFGQGIERNGARAEYWLTKAAEDGLVEAQSILGVMYATGQGVPIDRDKARYWLIKASAAGDQEAARVLKGLPRGKEI